MENGVWSVAPQLGGRNWVADGVSRRNSMLQSLEHKGQHKGERHVALQACAS